jgi:hypothetical protein
MNAIRIRKRLDSATLPELKPLIGRTVEIIVLEEKAATKSKPKKGRGSASAVPEWIPAVPSIESLAKQQGTQLRPIEKLPRGVWPADELNDGFEQARHARLAGGTRIRAPR